MDCVVVRDSENSGVGDNKRKGENMVKGSKIGSAQRRRLADISNLKPNEPLNQDVKQLPISLSTKDYFEKLHKENMTLMKLLADRNKYIELSGIELQKLRINLQKLQQQNFQLAQANSQMLAELNSGKDRLKALQHELGCKNGLLKARKLELEVKVKKLKCQNTENEVGTTTCDEAGESSQADKGDIKRRKTNRRWQSKNQSFGPTTVRPVQAKEDVENKRRHSRRQSARFKSEEPESTEDLFETEKDLGPTTAKSIQATNENVDNKRCHSRRQSARFKSEEPEPTEVLFDTDKDLGPTTAKSIQATNENVDNKRRHSRRQSARFKSEEPEPTEVLFDTDKDLGPTTAKSVQAANENVANKRPCLRRQSARFKSEEPEPTEDLFEIDDAKFRVSPLLDDLVNESSQMSSVKKEDEEGYTALRFEAQEIRRSSVGRPLRQAAEKVQSYKEFPRNLKMRRPE